LTAALDPRLRVWRYRIFAATWLCYAGYYFCRKPFFITKATLGEELHFDASVLGDIGAAYLIAYTGGEFVSGVLGNRFGPRILLLGAMAISIASNLVFGIANSPETFMAFMVLNGLAQASGWSGNVGTMANWFHRHERGRVMGIWATNYQVGGVLANALAAWMLGAYGFRYSFFAGTIVLAAVWVFVLVNQRNRPEDLGLPQVLDPEELSRPASPEPKGLGWTRAVVANVLLVGVFYFFVKFIRYALWSWAPFFLQRHLAVQGDEAGYLSTVFDVFGVTGVIVTGFLSDKVFNSRRAGVSLLMMLALVASCVFLYGVGRFSLPVFAICLGLVGFTLYGPDALMTGAGAMDIGSRRGATLAAGIINGMGSIGAVVQELAIGRLFSQGEASLGTVFFLILAAAVLATLVLGVVGLRNRLGRSDV
jgi:OPA family glycerol-3-phosphate transporter-like MFS transporter